MHALMHSQLKLSCPRCKGVLTWKYFNICHRHASYIFSKYGYWFYCRQVASTFSKVELFRAFHFYKCMIQHIQGDPRWLCFIISLRELLKRQNMKLFYEFWWPYIWTFWYSMCTELSGPLTKTNKQLLLNFKNQQDFKIWFILRFSFRLKFF